METLSFTQQTLSMGLHASSLMTWSLRYLACVLCSVIWIQVLCIVYIYKARCWTPHKSAPQMPFWNFQIGKKTAAPMSHWLTSRQGARQWSWWSWWLEWWWQWRWCSKFIGRWVVASPQGCWEGDNTSRLCRNTQTMMMISDIDIMVIGMILYTASYDNCDNTLKLVLWSNYEPYMLLSNVILLSPTGFYGHQCIGQLTTWWWLFWRWILFMIIMMMMMTGVMILFPAFSSSLLWPSQPSTHRIGHQHQMPSPNTT